MKLVLSMVLLVLGSFPLYAIESVPDVDDPYAILGVDPDVNDESLTEAWRDLVKVHHPDSGGAVKDAQILNEAYQFLKKYRMDYDRRLMPFRGQFKKRETRPVPFTTEEVSRYQLLFLQYIRQEHKARQIAGSEYRPVFLLYAILNLKGDHGPYREMQSWKLRAYKDLLMHLDLLSLTNSELEGILLRDPVEALAGLLEHFDNFNIRLSTLKELFAAYNEFYLETPLKSRRFLALIERMEANKLLYGRRFEAIREMALQSLKDWLAYYLTSSQEIRARYEVQYQRTKKMVLKLEPFPRSALTCVHLLLGIRP